ncbi:MAG: phospholipid carrier-dependent glycosyltransferase [Deltaproteobacteria bacterium]|jgi:dolichyl-phosphate-mannose--protein O-mannosyl transferase|nr:phospholipid carrier-dependent glycosyltransferase [Deltaproteobacteria bacterium]
MSKKGKKQHLDNQQLSNQSSIQNQNYKNVTGFKKIFTFLDKPKNQKPLFWGVLLFIVLVSFLTHFRGYQKPAHFFWDENYHTPSAYKYLHKTFYMEPHPPLGKLFIAWGEYLYNYTGLLDWLGPIGFTKRGDYVYSELDDVIDRKVTAEKEDLLSEKNIDIWDLKIKKDTKNRKKTKVTESDKEEVEDDPNNQWTVLDELTSKSYIKTAHKQMQFLGLRFFPTLFSWLSVPVFFFILYQLSSRPLLALAFTSLYLFENSMILHFRSAMLDSIQIFFILTAISYFLHLFKTQAETKWFQYIIWGSIISLAIATKITGAILGFLFLFVCFKNFNYREYLNNLKAQFVRVMLAGVSFFVGLVTPFLVVLYIHFSLAQVVDKEGNWYEVSPELQSVIQNGLAGELKYFPLFVNEAFKFTKKYNKGVPALDVCKSDENGSAPMTWMFGGKSINYSWKKGEHCNNKGTAYYYLQANPLILAISFFGLLFAFILVSGRLFYGLQITDQESFKYMLIFLFLYIVYMLTVFNIPRVMYFYHYFIPYIFTMLITFNIFLYAFKKYIVKKDLIVLLALVFFVIQIVAVYHFYSPFIYANCLTTEEFYKRDWFDLWKLLPIM